MFEVGQKLWFVPEGKWHGLPREVIILKIGRQYLHLNLHKHRVNIDTMRVDDDGYFVGHCYKNKEEYEHYAMRLQAWNRFSEAVRLCGSSIPNNLTLEQIFEMESQVAKRSG